jgi:hypothetical protein
MSFLDSLENNLKALEGTEQSGLDEQKRKDKERRRAAASAPWAERLKNSAFTQSLMQQATRAGFQIRTKVNFVWLGTTLRLEARNHRLELRPAAEGVEAVALKDGVAVGQELIDLTGKPEAILNPWMKIVAAQKKQDEEAAAKAEAEAAALDEEEVS